MEYILISFVYQLFYYKITFVNSQHKNTNSKGYFILQNCLNVCFIVHLSIIIIKNDNSKFIGQIARYEINKILQIA